MRVASRSRRRNEGLLRGGLDVIGHHAGDIEERERQLDRNGRASDGASRPHRAPGFMRRCITENPFASIAGAAAIGVLLGAALCRLPR